MIFICMCITIISSLVSLGFSFNALSKAKTHDKLMRDNAKYAVARSLTLAILALGLLIFYSTTYLVIMAVAMILVQLFDGFIGLKISLFKTVGPFITAIFNLIFLILALR